MEFHGVFNPQRAKQLLLFEGVSSDGLGMTDIDGLIEYKDRALIFYEIKGSGKAVPMGQRLALQRLVKDADRAGKLAIAVVAEHGVEDAEKPVFVKDCKVREIYYGKEKAWRKPRKQLTAGEITDIVINMAKI